MSKSKIVAFKKLGDISEDPLTDLLRSGARKLIADAVELELQELLNHYSHQRNEFGHKQIVRNGYLPEREIQTGVGPVKVRVPKIRDKSGHGIKFNSSLLPPYLRKTQKRGRGTALVVSQGNINRRFPGGTSGPSWSQCCRAIVINDQPMQTYMGRRA